MLVVLLTLVVASSGVPDVAPPSSSDDDTTVADDDVQKTFAWRLGGCLAQEVYAALSCCGSVGLIAFGVATLGFSPVFANVPIPFGVCGIGLGALAFLSAVVAGLSAPVHLFAPQDVAPDPPDAPDPPATSLLY